MSSVEDKVLEAYNRDPRTVNDDKYLIPAVWRLEGWDESSNLFENFKRVSNPESITRARRNLHEQGLIKYSKEASDRRMKEFKDHQEKFGKKEPIFDHKTNTVRIEE